MLTRATPPRMCMLVAVVPAAAANGAPTRGPVFLRGSQGEEPGKRRGDFEPGKRRADFQPVALLAARQELGGCNP